MKQFKFFAVALAALTVFSCSKENTLETGNPTTGKTVQLTIAKSDAGNGSKAIQDPAAAAYKTTIAGNEIEVFCFASNAADAVLLYTKLISVTESSATYTATLTKVPSGTNYIYIVANNDMNIGGTVGVTTLKQIRDKSTVITPGKRQNIGNTTMTNATDAAQTIDKVTDTAVWKLSLNISPVMARIEVASVVATTDITAFDLVGVYVNGYYPSYTLGGEGAGTFVPYVTDGTLLPTTGSDWNYDLYAGGLTQQMNYNAGQGKTWGYMLAPAAAAAQMPRIVLKLDNVKVSGAPHSLNYITVKKFKTQADVEIKTLDRNSIYRISKIEFNQANLTADPNQDDVSVAVTVDVLPWNVVDVKPEL